MKQIKLGTCQLLGAHKYIIQYHIPYNATLGH